MTVDRGATGVGAMRLWMKRHHPDIPCDDVSAKAIVSLVNVHYPRKGIGFLTDWREFLTEREKAQLAAERDQLAAVAARMLALAEAYD